MSILKVDTINEKTSGNGVAIPGHVIQVVTAASTTETFTTSTSFVNTSLSVTITPKFNTSKIFITISSLGICLNTQYVVHKLLRGSTVICGDFAYNNNNYWMPVNYAMSILDSPATTSATTYKTQIRLSNAGDLRYNYGGDGSGTNASITAMEIAA